MLVRNYLINNPDLDEFSKNFNVKCKRSLKNPSLVLFKYNNNHDFSNEIRKQCRSIILDEKDNWKIVSYPYDKFFNFGEKYAEEIIFNENTKVYEKYDGSIMTIYYYNGVWNVSSSGSVDADGNVGDKNIKYRDLFWNIWGNLNYILPEETNFCFIFELISPKNIVIVDYKEDNLILHGVRNLTDLKEYDHTEFGKKYEWNYSEPEIFTNNVKFYKNKVDSKPPLECEGVILCDQNFKRLKIKSKNYLKLAHTKQKKYDNKFEKFVDMKKSGYDPEIFLLDNELAEEYENFEKKLLKLDQEIEEVFQHLKENCNNQKEFFFSSKNYWYQNALLSKKSNKFEGIINWASKFTSNKDFIDYFSA